MNLNKSFGVLKSKGLTMALHQSSCSSVVIIRSGDFLNLVEGDRQFSKETRSIVTQYYQTEVLR